jgi:hypothetical protein
MRGRRALIIGTAVLAAMAAGTGIVYAAFVGSTTNSGNVFSAAADWVAPTVDRTVIARTTGEAPGYIKASDTFYVYANVTDTGNPASGTSAVTTNIGNLLSTGGSNVSLSSGSFSVGGNSYNYRTASQTASSSFTDGAKSYTITTTDSATNSGTTSYSVIVDNTAPSVSATVIARSTICSPGTTGFIKQGAAYYVYANVSDGSGSGIQTVTAGVSNITTGQTAASLIAAGGPFSVGGVSYTYRSSQLTANGSLSAGSKSYTVTLQDNLNTSQTQSGYSVTVDNTAPAASDIQTANTSGQTQGKPEQGDTVIYTFSEQIEPCSVLAGWTGASTNVVVRIADGNVLNGDRLTVWDSSNTSELPLGSVNLSGSSYASNGDISFGASGISSTMVQSGSTLTISLGTVGGIAGTQTLIGIITWTPSASAADRAGNACSTTPATESGALDVEF